MVINRVGVASSSGTARTHVPSQVAPATLTSPSLSATPSDVPPKKRARLEPHTADIQGTPPAAHYTIGESSRATFRGPTTFSLYAQVTDQQGCIDRMRH